MRRRHSACATPIACVLGALTAFWLFWRVLPAVTIIAGPDGRWERVELDWTKTPLGRNR